MNRADLTKQVLLYDQLAAAAKAKAAEARVALDEQARQELSSQGMAPTWRLPDVGTVTLPLSQPAVSLTDTDALLKWAQAHEFPNATESVIRLRWDWVQALERTLVITEDAAVFPSTGEVVPGYTVRAGGIPQALSIRPSSEAKAMAREYADGLLERFEATLTGEVSE